jgi:integrase
MSEISETAISESRKAQTHKIMGGKVNVYRRENSDKWQCSTFLNGRNWRVTTKEDSLARAKDFAEDWYLGMRGKAHAGFLQKETKRQGKKFTEAAAKFLEEAPVLTQGQRSPGWLKQYELKISGALIPFFGGKYLSEITSGLIQEYRVHRAKTCKTGRAPSRSTVHKDIVCLRQILKTARRHGWIEYLPDMSAPYKTSGKVVHRAWFSPEEYKLLYEATRERAAKPKKERWRKACENMHDYVLFMANTGLRPDEAKRLERRDVTIADDEATSERILEIEVRGKRGVGFCKSMPGAVRPFERMVKRNVLQATDRMFGTFQRELFNAILDELELKVDRDGQRRTAYSLRHTYISMRLMEGADIYQIAKNCRTSVEMIQNFYASHIKNMLDTAAINVRKVSKRKGQSRKGGRSRPSADESLVE